MEVLNLARKEIREAQGFSARTMRVAHVKQTILAVGIMASQAYFTVYLSEPQSRLASRGESERDRVGEC